MNHDDDAGEDGLARIDLQAWRVPPPAADDRVSILSRALSPAPPRRRPRATWLFAAVAIANVVLAAIIVIILSHRPAATTVTVQPAGGGGVDAQTSELLRRLEQEQRELEQKLADVQHLRTVVEELAERVRQCEQADTRDRTGPKPRHEAPEPTDLGTCDEVSCVLSSYADACCAKFRRVGSAPIAGTQPPTSPLPETLDRQSISAGIAAIKPRVAACAQQSAAKGKVKVRVRVLPSGHVANVVVEITPDPPLAACVAGAVQKATFAPTQQGGSFSYPFVF